MTPPDAAKLLDLPADATPEQVEARFNELRARLEDKVAKAPTPGLKAKYRESLDDITAAFEILVLAADSSTLPSLRRSVPVPPAASALPAPQAKPAEAPVPTGPGLGTTILIHLAGCYKAGLGGLLVWLLLSIAWMQVNDSNETGIFILRLTVTGLSALAAVIWLWRRSVRRSRRRLAEGKKNTAENVLATVLTALGVLLFSSLLVLAHVRESDNNRAMLDRAKQSLAHQLPPIDASWAKCLDAEKEAKEKLRQLEAEERDLATRNASPGDRQDNQALIKAQLAYVRWFSDTLAAHPARFVRLRIDGVQQRLSEPEADGRALYAELSPALTDYQAAVQSLSSEIPRRAPDPVYVTGFAEWQHQAEAGNAGAMYNLYLTYDRGHGVVEADRPTAFAWLRKSADLGYPTAMASLASDLWFGHKDLPAEDKAEATRWYLKAAEAGEASAMAAVGDHYRRGDHLAKDPVQGIAWLRRAAEAGSIQGMTNLAQCLATGEDIARDDDAAIAWWRKAARKNDWSAKQALQKRNLTW